MGITITKVKTQKWVKDHHSKGIFPNGEKIEYFLTYDNEKVKTPKIKASSEMTSQTIRDWFHGKITMTVLMAEELGSNSLQGDLQAYLHINRQYESALNVPPPVMRQTQYYKPEYKKMFEMQGNTLSRAILEWQMRKAAYKIQVEKDSHNYC